MRKIAVCIITVMSLLLTASCSFTGDGASSQGTGDVIVLPEPSGNNVLNANQRNIVANNAYQQNVINKLYDKIGTDQISMDFAVDDRSIYVLKQGKDMSSEVESGDGVSVYDIESGSLVHEISLPTDSRCTAIAVKNKMIYLYDYAGGDILKYSIDGSYNGKTAFKMPHLKAVKMEAIKQGEQFAILDEDALYILNSDCRRNKKITASDLAAKLRYDKGIASVSMQDFCRMDENKIMIKVSPERLCLYDLLGNSVVKAAYIPDSVKLVEFASGILYSVSVPKVALYTNQVTNFSNEGGGSSIGRLAIGTDFPWSADSARLNDYQLGDIGIPFTERGLSHFKMKQNNKYLFFLDRGNISKKYKSTIYRISK